ncbi:hypothetical protein ACTID9_07360 [Brevibacillus fluminis]|uniref:Uncharacterized protein n=1 Tax=Brevibacillus fluminis TaxID=511487 RepID=A0A3M8DN44_9BACL|nr:hypothetical protein [Brevibacillus fluminis]RNB89496.1 hypothetical protein EDM56_09880 [Brevibacillus fluminis]
MTQFDVSLVHRLADQLEGVAVSMKSHVNNPDGLQNELQRVASIVNSLQELVKVTDANGANPVVQDNRVR